MDVEDLAAGVRGVACVRTVSMRRRAASTLAVLLTGVVVLLVAAGCGTQPSVPASADSLCGSSIQEGRMLYVPPALWALSNLSEAGPSVEFFLVTGSCSEGATVAVEPSSAAQVKVLTRDQFGLPTGVDLQATTEPMVTTLTRRDGVTRTLVGYPQVSP